MGTEFGAGTVCFGKKSACTGTDTEPAKKIGTDNGTGKGKSKNSRFFLGYKVQFDTLGILVT